MKQTKGNNVYENSIRSTLELLYDTAQRTRALGLDPSMKPEVKIAEGLAELVEGLVGPPGVAESIKKLSKKLPREELAFKIAEEVVYGRYGHMEPKIAAEQAVRTSLAILTEGITAAPLQGLAKVTFKENFDKTKYLAIYFSGPIRSAGGTDQALTLVVGDFIRRLLGLDRYKPTEEEANRFVEEMRLYERNVGRFQYHVSDSQLKMALESLPVEAAGTDSDPIEVQTFRDLPRIETNRVRGGTLRVVNDGVIGRAAKVHTITERLGIDGWDWLRSIGNLEESFEEEDTPSFMEDVIAGRPVFAFPAQRGGFRLRYGRARNTGLAAVGINPLTMSVLDRFLAGGTQVRIELPGKGGIVVPVDHIEPPTVLLEDGSVVKVTAERLDDVDKRRVKEILFLGDMLVSFGDFLYNNKQLPPSGYTEEWWIQEFKTAITNTFKGDIGETALEIGISKQRLEMLLSQPFRSKPNAQEAILISKRAQIPLHPEHTFFWSHISAEQLQELRRWLQSTDLEVDGDYVHQITGEASNIVKTILEHLCLPHTIVEDHITITGDEAIILVTCLGLNVPEEKIATPEPTLNILKSLSGIDIRAKAPTSIGARMGRPEKAKRRDMKPRVHILFPVGLSGGPQRNLIDAAKKGPVNVELTKRKCPACRKSTFMMKCSTCQIKTSIEKTCPRCGQENQNEVCTSCKVSTVGFTRQVVDLKEMIHNASRQLGVQVPKKLKGVKGLTNEHKIPEILEKGLLRAAEDLSMYKDGTIRFDATNAPLTHFKPNEVKTSIDKLRELGYIVDHQGKPLDSSNQICELKIQDVVIPRKCTTYLIRITRFLDQLLEKVYTLPKHYNVRKAQDLIGHLIIGLAPHTSVGIVGRIIGFTDLSVCYAHPLWHSAKRRDCDGDEDALMLALDTLINFSKEYLPSKIGGIMDAPLFIIPVVNPIEVQRQAHEFDIANCYPISFYEQTLEKSSPRNVKNLIELVEHKLGTEAPFEGLGYTTPVSNINMGNRESIYKQLSKMSDKLKAQLELAEKIRAVDAKKVALKVLTKHFLRDISGNLRAFSTQSFRCSQCGLRVRRVPLGGRCKKCRSHLAMTVHRGGIEKYLNAAKKLILKYQLPKYYLHRLALVESEIRTLFDGRKPRQISLADFA